MHWTRWKRTGDPLGPLKCAPNGAGSIRPDGYRVVTVGGKRIREHRHVMESILGRPLLASEIVHHRNGDKLDNRPANLELTDRVRHVAVDHFARFRSKTRKQCGRCMEIKPRSAFAPRRQLRSTHDPHASACRVCLAVARQSNRQ